MTGFTNLHTHTDFCDGLESAEQMVNAAIKLGCPAIGFSGHGYTWYDEEYCMSREGTAEYIQELLRLKSIYRDRIAVFTGIEQDNLAGKPDEQYDFIIGSTHYIEKNGVYIPIDESRETLINACREYYGGDMYELIRDYYEQESKIAENTSPDIVGHFDLIMKFNDDGSMFDPDDRRYIDASKDALKEAVSGCALFEVNTGAMYKGYRSSPYPSAALLKALRDMGGRVIITSDSHDSSSLGYGFEAALELVKSCGFKCVSELTEKGIEQRILTDA